MAAAWRRVIAALTVARGAQLLPESASAVRSGEEGVDLLVGQLSGELVEVVVGPPVDQFAPGKHERPHRIPHRLTITLTSPLTSTLTS